MNTHQTKIKVRYGETDQMGVVYHGNYANYLEIGRLDWLDAIGVSYKEMEANDVMLPRRLNEFKVLKISYLRRYYNCLYYTFKASNGFN
jgi:acyl-CoA thioester hydrolase